MWLKCGFEIPFTLTFPPLDRDVAPFWLTGHYRKNDSAIR